MINNIAVIREMLIKYISTKTTIDIVRELTGDKHNELVLVPNILTVIIESDEITVSYADEYDEFLKVPYKSKEQWIQSAGDFIFIFLTHTVTAEYYYSKRKKTLLYYKIWAENSNNHRRLLKRVSLSLNPFLLFQSKEVVSKTLHAV